MKPGPSPIPTVLKELRGNPGQRRLNKSEPQPKPGFPACPDHLGPTARGVWEYLRENLPPTLITRVDLYALEIFCNAVALYRQAVQDIKDGTFPAEGSQSPFPHTIMNQSIKVIRQFCHEFGLTPAARSRLTMPEEKPVDSFDTFLKLTG